MSVPSTVLKCLLTWSFLCVATNASEESGSNGSFISGHFNQRQSTGALSNQPYIRAIDQFMPHVPGYRPLYQIVPYPWTKSFFVNQNESTNSNLNPYDEVSIPKDIDYDLVGRLESERQLAAASGTFEQSNDAIHHVEFVEPISGTFLKSNNNFNDLRLHDGGHQINSKPEISQANSDFSRGAWVDPPNHDISRSISAQFSPPEQPSPTFPTFHIPIDDSFILSDYPKTVTERSNFITALRRRTVLPPGTGDSVEPYHPLLPFGNAALLSPTISSSTNLPVLNMDSGSANFKHVEVDRPFQPVQYFTDFKFAPSEERILEQTFQIPGPPGWRTESCFYTQQMGLLINASPIERFNSQSLDQCARMCDTSEREISVICRSFVFSTISQECTLYNQISGVNNALLVPVIGYVYHEARDDCLQRQRSGTSSLREDVHRRILTEVPSAPRRIYDNTLFSSQFDSTDLTASVEFKIREGCDLVTAPVMLYMVGWRPLRVTGSVPIDDVDLELCVEACRNNRGDTLNFRCMTAVYFKFERKCLLEDDFPGASLSPPQDLFPDSRAQLIEKLCIDVRAADRCTLETLLEVRNKLLIGFADEVLNKETLRDCVESCLMTSMRCRSVTFFSDTDIEGNCIINSKDHEMAPEALIDSLNEESYYVSINGCHDGPDKKSFSTASGQFTQDNLAKQKSILAPRTNNERISGNLRINDTNAKPTNDNNFDTAVGDVGRFSKLSKLTNNGMDFLRN